MNQENEERLDKDTLDKDRHENVIEEIEGYFRTSALARVTILPRWIIS